MSSYCTASDVATLNRARIMGQGQNPTASDVTGYIGMVAGEIDAVLVNKGYAVPVNTASYPEIAGLLQGVNAKGAMWMMEEASPNSPNVDRAKAAYDASLKMLADAQFVMDLPMEVARSEPRGPWLTFRPSGRTYDPMFAPGDGSDTDPGNQQSDPYFSRGQRF